MRRRILAKTGLARASRRCGNVKESRIPRELLHPDPGLVSVGAYTTIVGYQTLEAQLPFKQVPMYIYIYMYIFVHFCVFFGVVEELRNNSPLHK